jgi:hypothetical protein
MQCGVGCVQPKAEMPVFQFCVDEESFGNDTTRFLKTRCCTNRVGRHYCYTVLFFCIVSLRAPP